MKNKKGYIFFGVVFGALCLLAAIALGLAFIHVGDFIYAADCDILNIPETSGYSKEVCVNNYKAMMDFLSPFKKTEFNLPDLAFSETGAFHFEECRNLFIGFYLAGAFSAVLIVLFSITAKKRKINNRFLLVSSITTLTIPAFLLAAFSINFDAAFIVFHKIFFNNDFWYFDYRTDQIINILPETFFMHCAIIITVFLLLAAVVQYILYKKYGKQHNVIEKRAH